MNLIPETVPRTGDHCCTGETQACIRPTDMPGELLAVRHWENV